MTTTEYNVEQHGEQRVYSTVNHYCGSLYYAICMYCYWHIWHRYNSLCSRSGDAIRSINKRP